MVRRVSTTNNLIVDYPEHAPSPYCPKETCGAPTETPPGPGPLTITGTPPTATVGLDFSFTPTVTGGTPPYTFAVSAGTLPGGLTLDASTGELTGIPTAAADVDFTITVTDTDGNTADLAVSLSIIAA